MNTLLHRSLSRGLTSAGWLVSRHSFSFNQWYDPNRVQFGALRVLNDDLIMPGQGFPPHSHENMEIVTIPLKGAVAHKDSSGGEGVTKAGDVQIMSAGTGVAHSEYNASSEDPLELLQIWVLPERSGLLPRYEQKTFDAEAKQGQWQLLVSPDAKDGSLQIFQQAWFSVANIAAGGELGYEFFGMRTGAYIFVISGNVEVFGTSLGRRDALSVADVPSFTTKAQESSEVLVIEIKM